MMGNDIGRDVTLFADMKENQMAQARGSTSPK
jgi:hypothetical protein